MSIEVRKKQDKKSSSFGMKVAMPNLRNKGSAIKIQANTNMEKKKEDKMEKKEEKKFFYELLAETWQKGILSRGHTANYDADGPGCYYCPICCVCEYLGLIPKIRIGSERKHHLEHFTMVGMLREKCKFIDNPVMLDVKYEFPRSTMDFGYSKMTDENEPMLAFSTAAAYHRRINNGRIAEMLKEQLYDGKKPMLEREKEELYPQMMGRHSFPTIEFTIQGADVIAKQLGQLNRNIKDLSLEAIKHDD